MGSLTADGIAWPTGPQPVAPGCDGHGLPVLLKTVVIKIQRING